MAISQSYVKLPEGNVDGIKIQVISTDTMVISGYCLFMLGNGDSPVVNVDTTGNTTRQVFFSGHAIQGSQRSKISKRCPTSKSEQFAKSKPQTAKALAPNHVVFVAVIFVGAK